MNNARESVCDSVIDCILDLFVSGKIGGTMKRFKLVRFIADLIFFVFFGLLLSNIVSGIMIDTFAELRNKRDQMHDDKKNKCYICGKDRASVIYR
jgi:inositol 1,4,5-triphosphate receptor type 1/inositol 1,4,5-triphosphate receptor type 3